MIKKVLGFVTIGNVSVLMMAMVGIVYLFIKRFEPAILYLLLAIALLFINVLFRKYGEALELADKYNDNGRDAIQEAIWNYDELQLEMQRHRLTGITRYEVQE